ncbi:hypothetical protein TNIN_134711 [Trichonephila inaurata madagascariensis]|uniref:Uncharacterized protein n=1 Tax=Trichonephila inaurata madagascariensis TaxID=2747483 RepID=A0A8X6YPC3_9ARAC|nr:hypothetical protein TNIN_134711 [Trichonephila inaurata madagascariensis]
MLDGFRATDTGPSDPHRTPTRGETIQAEKYCFTPFLPVRCSLSNTLQACPLVPLTCTLRPTCRGCVRDTDTHSTFTEQRKENPARACEDLNAQAAVPAPFRAVR